MPDPAGLLTVARLLAASDAVLSPSQEQLRRAVSTAYYALFHKVLRAGTERFMGTGTEAQPGYALLYRGYNHGRIRNVCLSIEVDKLSPSLRRQLGITEVSQDMRDFATGFLALYEARHRADYDPHPMFAYSDTITLVDQAEFAMQAFDRTDREERTGVLALMLVSPRD